MNTMTKRRDRRERWMDCDWGVGGRWRGRGEGGGRMYRVLHDVMHGRYTDARAAEEAGWRRQDTVRMDGRADKGDKGKGKGKR